jgi:hypothetical protein
VGGAVPNPPPIGGGVWGGPCAAILTFPTPIPSPEGEGGR